MVHEKEFTVAKQVSQHHNPRDLALTVLVRLDKSTMGSQDALSRALDDAPTLTSVDRRLATQLVYGCMRQKLYLDYIIHQATTHGTSKLNSHVRWALRIATFQLCCLDRIPNHAAVDNGVRQVKSVAGQGLAGFSNAILRKIAVQWENLAPKEGKSAKSLSHQYSHPQWIVEAWAQRWPDVKLREMCEAFSKPAPVVVRIRTDSVIEARKWLNEKGKVTWDEGFHETCLRIHGGLDPRSTPLFEAGKWISQDEGSQKIVHSLSIPPGARVLDYCAGTGTKTTQILDAVGPSGTVVACDIKESKLRKLKALCERWGQNVEVKKLDGRKDDDWKPTPFDYVLVDAPCTGLGTIRRRPEIKWRRSKVDLRRTSTDQKQLLLQASTHVAPGGILAYAVCSNVLEECEEVTAAFLAQSNGQFKKSSFPGEDAPGEQSLDPTQEGVDGFFIAHFIRVS